MDIAQRERQLEERERRYQQHVEQTTAKLTEAQQKLAQALVDVDAERVRRLAHVEARDRAVGRREHDCALKEEELRRQAEDLRLAQEKFAEEMRQERAAFEQEQSRYQDAMDRREKAFGEGVSMLEVIARAEEALDKREAELKAAEAAHQSRVERDRQALEHAMEAFRNDIAAKTKALQAWADSLVGDDRVKAIAEAEANLAEREAELELNLKRLANEKQQWREAMAKAKQMIRASSRQRAEARQQIRELNAMRREHRSEPMRLRASDG